MSRVPALFFICAGAVLAQTPTINAVVNAGTYGTQLCPGMVAQIFGTNFGTDASKVSVSVGGKAGYVITPITNNQIAFEIPFELSAGSTSVTVTIGSAQSSAFPITLATVAPAFLSANA